MRTFYRRNLPHYQPSVATYFTTFRLAGSLPLAVTENLRRERENSQRFLTAIETHTEKRGLFQSHQPAYFERFSALIDGSTHGPHWLGEPRVAEVVSRAIHSHDNTDFELFAFCIMPNHVHMIFHVTGASGNGPLVTDILRQIKGKTARECNLVLHRSGPFWQHESYDHVVRDSEELRRTIWYVLHNPVKAALVNDWSDWPWTYVKKGLL